MPVHNIVSNVDELTNEYDVGVSDFVKLITAYFGQLDEETRFVFINRFAHALQKANKIQKNIDQKPQNQQKQANEHAP